MPELRPAAELRAAAKLMRERAGRATAGPWETCQQGDCWLVMSSLFGQVATSAHEDEDADAVVIIERDHRDAEYVASMHPGVARAVADWLDAEAQKYDGLTAAFAGFLSGDAGLGDPDPALMAARAYLGEEQR